MKLASSLLIESLALVGTRWGVARVEYVVAGISSLSVQELTARVVEDNQALSDLGLAALVPRFDELLLAANPHYRYSKSQSYGFALVEVDRATEVRVTFVQVPNVEAPEFDGVVERVRFRTVAGSNRVETA